MVEKVILVDEHDNPMGEGEKQRVHEKGLLHRAFSVFIVRESDKGFDVLLQQRQLDKYHCGGLWTNSCCGHPRPGETLIAAAERRLAEEMGLDIPLHEVGVFHYIAQFDNDLTENEIDHVCVGFYNGEPIEPNQSEVASFRWVAMEELQQLLLDEPNNYTPWFEKALEVARKSLSELKQ